MNTIAKLLHLISDFVLNILIVYDTNSTDIDKNVATHRIDRISIDLAMIVSKIILSVKERSKLD